MSTTLPLNTGTDVIQETVSVTSGYFTGGGNTCNNGTTTENITFSTDTSAIVPSAYFSSSVT